jgi:hypothetical protein
MACYLLFKKPKGNKKVTQEPSKILPQIKRKLPSCFYFLLRTNLRRGAMLLLYKILSQGDARTKEWKDNEDL